MDLDLTPIATEHAQLAAFKEQAEIDMLLDANFATDYHRCACGAMIVADEARCYPCSQGNRAHGPIYGASLAGHTPAPGDALRAVDAIWGPAAWPEQAEVVAANACRACVAATARIDDLLEQNDALGAEKGALARQVASLKGQLYEAQCALTRAEKVREPLALLQAEERMLDLSRSYDTLVETCTQQTNRLAACRCGA